MNPEEGDLRPQLLDRFGLSVEVVGSAATPRCAWRSSAAGWRSTATRPRSRPASNDADRALAARVAQPRER